MYLGILWSLALWMSLKCQTHLDLRNHMSYSSTQNSCIQIIVFCKSHIIYRLEYIFFDSDYQRCY